MWKNRPIKQKLKVVVVVVVVVVVSVVVIVVVTYFFNAVRLGLLWLPSG